MTTFHQRHVALLLVLAALGCVSAVARADHDAKPVETPRSLAAHVSLGTGTNGYGWHPTLLGADLILRVGWLEGGAMADIGLEDLGRVRTTLAALGGVAWEPESRQPRVVLDGLLALGVRRYDAVGGEGFTLSECKDPGADGTVPYAGARAQIAFLTLGDVFSIGVVGQVSADLRRRVDYSTRPCEEDPVPRTKSEVVGTTELSIGLRVGGVIGF